MSLRAAAFHQDIAWAPSLTDSLSASSIFYTVFIFIRLFIQIWVCSWISASGADLPIRRYRFQH